MDNIMLVDDSAFSRVYIKDRLRSLHDVQVICEASNGVEAIELYKKLKPSLVLMDITMPIMDGIECVKRIKEYDVNAKVIMLSAMGQKPMIIEAVKNGAIGFLVKPVDETKLCNEVEKVLGHTRVCVGG